MGVRVKKARGRVYSIPGSPSAVGFLNMLRHVLVIVHGAYLYAVQHHEVYQREDSTRGRIRDLILSTDRKRELTAHQLDLLVDGFVKSIDVPHLVDASGRGIVRSANESFSAFISAVAKGRRIPAQIQAIDLRSQGKAFNLVDHFREKNLGLVKSLVGREVMDLENTLRENYGASADTLTKAIQERQGVSDSRAALLARDQTLKLASQVTQQRAKDVGADSYIWISSNDERVRGRPGGLWEKAESNHWTLHGKRFKYSEPPITNPKKGIRNNPGEDFQCRCVASPDLEHIFGE